jgi:hypothetical protein
MHTVHPLGARSGGTAAGRCIGQEIDRQERRRPSPRAGLLYDTACEALSTRYLKGRDFATRRFYESSCQTLIDDEKLVEPLFLDLVMTFSCAT